MNVTTLVPAARECLVVVGDRAPLTEAAARLGGGPSNILVACGADDAMVGVVSKTDIVARISTCAGHACTTPVDAVMRREVCFCRPDERLESVWSRMKDTGFTHLPIVDEAHRPIGVLTARDALQALLGEVAYEESLLRDYVMGIGYR